MVSKEVKISIVVLFVAIAGFFLFFNNGPEIIIQEGSETNQEGIIQKNIFELEFMEIVLKDVNTQEEFKLSDFSGKPILLESFAVWCPTCTSQQKEVKKLHEEIGDSFISISLDTDPNEDESKILEHTERNNFNWIYVVSPVELTKGLIDEFGISFVNAPQAPIVLICPDGSSKKLRNGVKKSSELKTEIENCNS